MAEDTKETPRVLTEGEAYAIAAAEVKRETAERDKTIEMLESEKAELREQMDAELAKLKDLHDVALAAEKERADAAEKALTDFKAEIENERVVAARVEERTAKVREAAKNVKEDWFTAERASRWASMEDEAFETYVRELAEVAAAAPVTNASEPPRETAMAGVAVETKTESNLKKLWGVN